MILSGYLGSAAIAEVVAGFVARAKARNGALRYTLDPVLGDRDRGLFVKADIPPVVRDRLLPLADVITPNHFEFEWLCGAEARTLDQVLAQARGLIARGPGTVVITSAELAGTPADEIETLAVERTARLAGAHAARADQPERHRRSLRRAVHRRARSSVRTRRRRWRMRRPGYQPCWSARELPAPRKCASSRARTNSCIRRAVSRRSRSRRAD